MLMGTAPHGHDHDDDPVARRNALRAEALEALLVERGVVRPDLIDAIVARYEHEIGPLNGARVVARAWSDAAFRDRLLADAWAAIRELGLPTGPEATPIVVVPNTPDVHNVVVCTLCSCYPSALLGLPPSWYKSPPYRSSVVREPRAVLREMGLDLAAGVEIRVWDSSAEVRGAPRAPGRHGRLGRGSPREPRHTRRIDRRRHGAGGRG
jgi:nitrile hydratase